MKKRYLEAARLTKTVGLKGEMRAQVLCDDCGVLKDFDLYLGREHKPVRVSSAYPTANDMCKLKIEGIDTVEKAQPLIGSLLYLDREDAELPEDTWFIADILGLPVYDADTGELYGEVKEIMQNGPTDVYLLKDRSGRELMFPAIPEVLLNVDEENGKILIRPLKGLFDDTEASVGDGAEHQEV
ncbi:MAG: ribosome maturation factor RimM [Bacteroides sp.]|nr:ribosome maturation factor RimM [Bacteroides sp.]